MAGVAMHAPKSADLEAFAQNAVQQQRCGKSLNDEAAVLPLMVLSVSDCRSQVALLCDAALD